MTAASSATASSPEYDWLSIDADEEIVWSDNPHPMSIVPALLVGVPLMLLVVGFFIVGGAYLWRENTDYVVTSDGLYKKTGVLSRDVQKIGFDKVQNISFSQGVVGNFFGYGNVDISTAGGSGVEMQFQSVADPKSVQERINRRIKESRGRDDHEEPPEKDQVLDEILGELRAMRETFERIEAAQVDDTDGSGSTDGSRSADDAPRSSSTDGTGETPPADDRRTRDAGDR